MVKFCVLLQMSSSTTQMLFSKEEYIPGILTVSEKIHHVYIFLTFVVFVFWLSFINNRLNNITTMSTNQSSWPHSRQILHHQHGISIVESRQNDVNGKEEGETAAFRGSPCLRKERSYCWPSQVIHTLKGCVEEVIFTMYYFYLWGVIGESTVKTKVTLVRMFLHNAHVLSCFCRMCVFTAGTWCTSEG